ncbi:hypothetical protein [Rickettsiales endosymbiont of Peranema trichophorum]|uniref:hypothetical protein n=1 Tax=Rickettsiales endosymbiont of Peranema trichophorum TaxID=2486577 RepID=UPI0013EEE3CA|nr:hypothetical protein [Rickettsiales endosymbiont of Peranema trichophorum]
MTRERWARQGRRTGVVCRNGRGEVHGVAEEEYGSDKKGRVPRTRRSGGMANAFKT